MRLEWGWECGLSDRQMDRVVAHAKEIGAVHFDAIPTKRVNRQIGWYKLTDAFVKKIQEMQLEKRDFHSDTVFGTGSEFGKGSFGAIPKSAKEGVRPIPNSATHTITKSTTITKKKTVVSPGANTSRNLSVVKKTKIEQEEDMKPNKGKGKEMLLNKKGISFDEAIDKHKQDPDIDIDISKVGGYEKYWKRLRKISFPGNFEIGWSGTEQGYAISLIKKSKKYGSDMPLREMTKAIIENWADAAGYVSGELGYKKFSKTPDISFVAGKPQKFLEWFRQFRDTPKKTAKTNQWVSTHKRTPK